MMKHTRVYSPDGTFLGTLQNAKPQYTLKDVPLHGAKFTLPVDDPGNAICQMGNEVELYDSGTRVELFRIIGAPDAVYAPGGTITYTCEHVLAYLMNDVIFQYVEMGGTGVYTADCMDNILARQTVTRWVRGTCDFALQYPYSFENDTLLRAMLALPKQFASEYLFTYDTTVRPFVLNLVTPETQTECEMRYSRNMTEIRKSVDISQLVTRLYPLGYGEGVNQLTIKDKNEGVAYLDADTIGTWGVYASIWQDRTFERADALKARGQALLEEYKTPYISYKVKAVDLYPLTGEPFDRFMPGKLVRINDQEHGILVTARVTEITKKDVRGKPGDVEVTIANRSRSAAETIADLASRIAISELYANGQTCIYQKDFADNADKDHPATIPVDIPSECVRINKLRLKMNLLPFRSYSQGAAAGGGGTRTSTSGGGGSVTSEAGGGSTSGSSEVLMTSMDTFYTEPASLSISGNTGSTTPGEGGLGATVTTSENGGNTGYSGTGSTGSASGTTGSSSADVVGASGSADGSVGSHSHYSGSYTAASHTHSGPSHSHSGPSHAHSTPDHYHGVNAHSHTGASHYHSDGSLSIPDHDHWMAHIHGGTSHTHTVYSHTHTVSMAAHSHDVTLIDHTHDNVPGIYEGPTATSAVVTVDGNTVPAEAFEGDEVDIIPYLSKDENGKVLRNIRHTVTITPQASEGNTNGLSRIEAYVLVMTFVRSQGGGDY